MEDERIVELFFERSERAIAEVSAKYGGYCHRVVSNILQSPEDAEECLNDAYLAAWNSIPPARPQVLRTFLGRIARNVALKRYRYNTAERRGGGETALALDELQELIPQRGSVEDRVTADELAREIERFIASLGETERRLFIRRYWHFDSIETIAKDFGYGQSRVKSSVRGWVVDEENFVAVYARYRVEYDHTKTFIDDGATEQYFYLIRDPHSGEWSIADNSSPNT